MAFSQYTGITNKIAALGTTPQDRGLTTDEFKAKFDEFAEEFVTWFNGTHKGEIDELQNEVTTHLADSAAHPTIPRKNLLYNWDFRNPVNQRNVSSGWTTGYGIDRWTLSADNSSISLSAGNGLVINNTSGNCFLTQLFEIALLTGKTYTLSALLSDGSIVSFSHIPDATYTAVNQVFLQIGSNYITIGAMAGYQRIIAAVKLELGSVSTLANDAPADFEEQLQKCMRYYQSKKATGLYATAFNTTTLTGCIYPVEMRITPTVTIYDYIGTTPNVVSLAGVGSSLAVTNVNKDKKGIISITTNTTTQGNIYTFGYVADAEL